MFDIKKINFDKLNGLIPACIQHHETMQVLMIGFMNKESLQITIDTKRVTFWSRSKNRLWTKGETTGHYLSVLGMAVDCDQDSVLIYVSNKGPTCHQGTISCFEEQPNSFFYWLAQLEQLITQRKQNPVLGSYTNKLLCGDIQRIAQKVGEEAVETALAAVTFQKKELVNESVDLLYHLLVLLKKQEINLEQIAEVIKARMDK